MRIRVRLTDSPFLLHVSLRSVFHQYYIPKTHIVQHTVVRSFVCVPDSLWAVSMSLNQRIPKMQWMKGMQSCFVSVIKLPGDQETECECSFANESWKQQLNRLLHSQISFNNHALFKEVSNPTGEEKGLLCHCISKMLTTYPKYFQFKEGKSIYRYGVHNTGCLCKSQVTKNNWLNM